LGVSPRGGTHGNPRRTQQGLVGLVTPSNWKKYK
jgi:hypothetical protein